MTFKACVEHLEDGFFCPPSPLSELRVDESGQSPDQRRDLFVPVPGLERQMQFFRTRVCSTPDGRVAEHLICWASVPRFSKQRLVSLTPLLAGFARNASISFVLNSQTGWAEVFPGPAAPSIAIAVASLKLCYGWDESSPIVVKFGRLGYAVRDTFVDCTWDATLTAV